MTEASGPGKRSFTELLAYALVGYLLSLAAMAVVDAIYVLLGSGHFGGINGWLALVFPAIIFVEEFRAARERPGRLLAAVAGVVAGLGLGLLTAGLAGSLWPLVSGGIGALVTVIVYTLVWHVTLTGVAARRG